MDTTPHFFNYASRTLAKLAEPFHFAEYDPCGKSLLKEEIGHLKIGYGKRHIFLIGGADATDSISEHLLLRFSADLCKECQLNRSVYRFQTSYLLESRTIHILPRINPDGRHLVLYGADPHCVLYERQLHQNNMKNDFSNWKGNARGVLPGLNFNENFAKRRSQHLAQSPNLPLPMGEFPESEPECAHITKLIRFWQPQLVAEFICGQPAIYATNASYARRFSDMLDYPPSDLPPSGVCAWFGQSFDKVGIQHACLAGNSPDCTYEYIRKFLFHLLFSVT